MRHEKVREEIRFWCRLIEKWEATRGEPAPERMHEALAAAERRLQTLTAEECRVRIGILLH
jgi:hypothetical protein